MNFDLILLDIETQRDFFLPGGSLYTNRAETTRPNVHRLFDWARENRQPVISTVLRYPPGPSRLYSDVPHCIEGSPGEKKLNRTILFPYINLGMRNCTDLPGDLLQRYRQVIFEKRHPDIFHHTRAERLITELSQVSFVICGAGLAGGIVQAAVGLRNRGFGVVLASDAVLNLGGSLARMACRRMQAKGVLFLKTWEIIAPPHIPPAARPMAKFRTPRMVHRR